ncbi:chemotaxis response regulator protein-glutamate methylesterase [Labrys sp. LIt4]|uniref:Protein-glutamate methylesterase/protein-glutamine glutaminase n=1 Tax=Labrys okinawensis TaxID=346911 RepID=A0A2S9QJE1_9HYPH|nr:MULTISPECIES: chemotaxis response regulator protein-glutamate methylesterase [Labrys]MBP0580313.1 chemotaxis response regulator protein-glutamate methylesterase [Labrys sp. LIt4]PRH89465.1 chemotaxis response regulator protein-glutamate methylesterase [Labrys okinawensis]
MRIAIVNDLPLAVEAMRRVLAMAPQHQLAWVAVDGAQAVELCRRDRPDLVLMDLIMPRMDGIEATRRIMAQSPCAILIVTADVETNASRVFAAMGEGALDAVDTPLLGSQETRWGARPLLAKIDVIANLVNEGNPKQRPVDDARPQARQLVAIGASAGGPTALATVLKSLPNNFAASIVIIQHVDARFAPGLANWLSQHSALPVRLASEGDRALPGQVLVAGTDNHLVFKSNRQLGYTPNPIDQVYRPSVDVFFDSVARLWGGTVTGVLLTGMGSDGARGLKALRDLGHHTIAQDQATSAVYGMPKAAATLDAATDILPLSRIASRLTELLGSPRLRRGTAP